MVYYKSANRFIWFTTKPHTVLDDLLTDLHTGLSGLLTDLHTGLDGILTDLHTALIGLSQSQKPAYLVYYKSTNRFNGSTK